MYIPIITNSPWAKLTILTTPKISVTPMLTSAYIPPMSRPLMTAWATVSHIWINRLLGFHQRGPRVFLRKDAGEIAVLPLHPDRVTVDVLPVRPDLDPSAGRHRGVTGGDIERGKGFAYLLRVRRACAFERIRQHEGLGNQAAGIFEQEFSGSLLEFGVHFLGILADIMIPVRHALQSFGKLADIFVEIRNDEAAGAAVDRNVETELFDGANDQDQVVEIGDRE